MIAVLFVDFLTRREVILHEENHDTIFFLKNGIVAQQPQFVFVKNATMSFTKSFLMVKKNGQKKSVSSSGFYSVKKKILTTQRNTEVF